MPIARKDNQHSKVERAVRRWQSLREDSGGTMIGRPSKVYEEICELVGAEPDIPAPR